MAWSGSATTETIIDIDSGTGPDEFTAEPVSGDGGVIHLQVTAVFPATDFGTATITVLGTLDATNYDTVAIVSDPIVGSASATITKSYVLHGVYRARIRVAHSGTGDTDFTLRYRTL